MLTVTEKENAWNYKEICLKIWGNAGNMRKKWGKAKIFSFECGTVVPLRKCNAGTWFSRSLPWTSFPSWPQLPPCQGSHAHARDSCAVPQEVRAHGDTCSNRWDFWPIKRYCSCIYRSQFWSYHSSAEICQFSSWKSLLQFFWPELMFFSLLIPKPLLQHYFSFDNPLIASFPSLSLAHLSSYVQA